MPRAMRCAASKLLSMNATGDLKGTKRVWMSRIGLGVILPLLGLIVLASTPPPGAMPLMLLIIVLCASLEGLGVALLASATTLVGTAFLFIDASEPYFFSQDGFLRLLVLGLVLPAVSAVVSRLRWQKKQLAQAEAELRKRSQALAEANRVLESEVAARNLMVTQLEVERFRLQCIMHQTPAGVVLASAPSGEVIVMNEEAIRIFQAAGIRPTTAHGLGTGSTMVS